MPLSQTPSRKDCLLDGLMVPKATFSSCLLIKDDNAILNQWIAYHYQALGLGKLMVAMDPYSVQSPMPLFNTWCTLTDLTIV